jgi:hypothetical protein
MSLFLIKKEALKKLAVWDILENFIYLFIAVQDSAWLCRTKGTVQYGTIHVSAGHGKMMQEGADSAAQ